MLLYFDREHATKKYARLQKEHEDQKEMLIEAERLEESSKLDLRKLEKACSALQKTIEELESEVSKPS